jgi:hypothetical protein
MYGDASATEESPLSEECREFEKRKPRGLE